MTPDQRAGVERLAENHRLTGVEKAELLARFEQAAAAPGSIRSMMDAARVAAGSPGQKAISVAALSALVALSAELDGDPYAWRSVTPLGPKGSVLADRKDFLARISEAEAAGKTAQVTAMRAALAQVDAATLSTEDDVEE